MCLLEIVFVVAKLLVLAFDPADSSFDEVSMTSTMWRVLSFGIAARARQNSGKTPFHEYSVRYTVTDLRYDWSVKEQQIQDSGGL